MRLQTKFILTILTVFIISILFLGILIFSNSKATFENQSQNHLLSVSKSTEANVNIFLEGQKSKIELVATQSGLSNEELKTMVSLDSNFYDMFVISENGSVIASSNDARLGLYRGNRDYFTKARNQTYINPVYFALAPKEYSIAVSTPFHGGVLVGSMKLDILNDIVAKQEGLGKTGEVLMAFVNEENKVVYFSDRKFSDKKIEVVSMDAVRKRAIYPALNKEEGLFSNLLDYRGAEVNSAAIYLDSINVAMVVKMDKVEILETIETLQKTIIFIIVVILILVVLIVYVLTRQISKEIEDISKDIDDITHGNLEIQLKKSGIFEIQNLISSLNRILASMKLAILRTGLNKGELGLGEAVKAREEAEARFKVLYEASSDAIMTLEPPTWNFTSGNPATIKLFGLKDEKQFISLSPGHLSPEKQLDGTKSSEKAKKMIEKAMKNGSNFFEWTHKKYKGENFLASVLLSRVKEGDKVYLQATVREIIKEGRKEK